MVVGLPGTIFQPGHVLKELVHGGTPKRVVASNRATLRLCRLRPQPKGENLSPLGAGRAPRGDPQRLIPGKKNSLPSPSWGT